MKLELVDKETKQDDKSATDMTGKPEYVGENRRRFQRRIKGDRRDMLRFEPENPDRRSHKDRRHEGSKDVWTDRDI